MEHKKEDLHLNIETVTPDTDDGQPNDQKHNHPGTKADGKDAASKPADHRSKEDEEIAAPETAAESAEETKKQAEESQNNENTDDDDEGAKIETVSA